MKNTIILFFAACFVAIAGCTKSNEPKKTNTPTPVVDSNAMKYTVNGLIDIYLEKTDDTFYVLSIAHIGGKQEKLTLSVTDLPANVTASFETKSGIPSFGSILNIASADAAPGTYPIKILGTSASDSVKEFNINLIIKTPPPPPPPPPALGCVIDIIGTYTSDYDFRGKGIDCIVDSISGVKNKVKISNLKGFPDPVYADLDCDKKTLTITQAKSGSLTLTDGYGVFTDKTMEIEYTVDSNHIMGIVYYGTFIKK